MFWSFFFNNVVDPVFSRIQTETNFTFRHFLKFARSRRLEKLYAKALLSKISKKSKEIKKWHHGRCFPVNIKKFFRTAIL